LSNGVEAARTPHALSENIRAESSGGRPVLMLMPATRRRPHPSRHGQHTDEVRIALSCICARDRWASRFIHRATPGRAARPDSSPDGTAAGRRNLALSTFLRSGPGTPPLSVLKLGEFVESHPFVRSRPFASWINFSKRVTTTLPRDLFERRWFGDLAVTG
jgi:hypothetical protein